VIHCPSPSKQNSAKRTAVVCQRRPCWNSSLPPLLIANLLASACRPPPRWSDGCIIKRQHPPISVWLPFFVDSVGRQNQRRSGDPTFNYHPKSQGRGKRDRPDPPKPLGSVRGPVQMARERQYRYLIRSGSVNGAESSTNPMSPNQLNRM